MGKLPCDGTRDLLVAQIFISGSLPHIPGFLVPLAANASPGFAKRNNVSNFKVLVTDHNIRPDGLDLLKESGAEVEILQAFSPQKTLVGASRDVDGILARAATMTYSLPRT